MGAYTYGINSGDRRNTKVRFFARRDRRARINDVSSWNSILASNTPWGFKKYSCSRRSFIQPPFTAKEETNRLDRPLYFFNPSRPIHPNEQLALRRGQLDDERKVLGSRWHSSHIYLEILRTNSWFAFDTTGN